MLQYISEDAASCVAVMQELCKSALWWSWRGIGGQFQWWLAFHSCSHWIANTQTQLPGVLSQFGQSMFLAESLSTMRGQLVSLLVNTLLLIRVVKYHMWAWPAGRHLSMTGHADWKCISTVCHRRPGVASARKNHTVSLCVSWFRGAQFTLNTNNQHL